MSLVPCALQAAKLPECAGLVPSLARVLCRSSHTCNCLQTVTFPAAVPSRFAYEAAAAAAPSQQYQQQWQQLPFLSYLPELQLHQRPILGSFGNASASGPALCRHTASVLLASIQQTPVCSADADGAVLSQCRHQLQQHRGLKQLRPYAEAPKPLPRYRKPSKDGRVNRMVIRVPPQVQLQLRDQQLLLTGKAGSTSLKLSFLDPTGLVAWQCHTQSTAAAASGPGTGSLLLLASPSKRCWRGIQTHVNNAVHGVMQGYLVGVTVQGVGYRMEPVPESTIAAALAARRGATDAAADGSGNKRQIIWEQEAEKTNVAYPHKQAANAVRLKVGYTRACIFKLPEGVLAFFIKPTLMYLYGVDKALVTNTAAAIRAIRKPNAFTGNGIQLVGENIKLKQRAGSK